MGSWFGVVFKIILPAVVMYRPIKMFSLSVVVFGLSLGGESQSLNNFSLILFFLTYAVVVIMLFLFPKAASVVEFFLIFYYFACLVVFYFVDFFRLSFEGMTDIVHNYARALPLVIVFLIGKILFFIFIKTNRYEFEKGKKKRFRN